MKEFDLLKIACGLRGAIKKHLPNFSIKRNITAMSSDILNPSQQLLVNDFIFIAINYATIDLGIFEYPEGTTPFNFRGVTLEVYDHFGKKYHKECHVVCNHHRMSEYIKVKKVFEHYFKPSSVQFILESAP
jgi:hypothetical protein